MKVLGSSGNQFRATTRRIGNLFRASEFLPNRVEVIELIGVPSGTTLNRLAAMRKKVYSSLYEREPRNLLGL